MDFQILYKNPQNQNFLDFSSQNKPTVIQAHAYCRNISLFLFDNALFKNVWLLGIFFCMLNLFTKLAIFFFKFTYFFITNLLRSAGGSISEFNWLGATFLGLLLHILFLNHLREMMLFGWWDLLITLGDSLASQMF